MDMNWYIIINMDMNRWCWPQRFGSRHLKGNTKYNFTWPSTEWRTSGFLYKFKIKRSSGKPFAFELFFCLANASTHQKLSQMHGFLWRTKDRVWLRTNVNNVFTVNIVLLLMVVNGKFVIVHLLVVVQEYAFPQNHNHMNTVNIGSNRNVTDRD